MEIKTYPLQFTEGKLREIESVAGKRMIKKFIFEAIEEKLKREKRVAKKPLSKECLYCELYDDGCQGNHNKCPIGKEADFLNDPMYKGKEGG